MERGGDVLVAVPKYSPSTTAVEGTLIQFQQLLFRVAGRSRGHGGVIVGKLASR
jgi:hypothetical protein